MNSEIKKKEKDVNASFWPVGSSEPLPSFFFTSFSLSLVRGDPPSAPLASSLPRQTLTDARRLGSRNYHRSIFLAAGLAGPSPPSGALTPCLLLSFPTAARLLLSPLSSFILSVASSAKASLMEPTRFLFPFRRPFLRPLPTSP